MDIEAITERAAIMEFDGGLDRKTALIKAAVELFPAEFCAIKENAAGHADADTLINLSQTQKKGAVFNTEAKNASQHENPPDVPSMKKRLKGFEKLAEYAGYTRRSA